MLRRFGFRSVKRGIGFYGDRSLAPQGRLSRLTALPHALPPRSSTELAILEQAQQHLQREGAVVIETRCGALTTEILEPGLLVVRQPDTPVTVARLGNVSGRASRIVQLLERLVGNMGEGNVVLRVRAGDNP
jgi:hypothetical protein